MGIDVSDANGDGIPDFVLTTFNDQYTRYCSALLRTSLRTARSHLAGGIYQVLCGWGTKFIDYDNDGSMDLVIVDGHINQVIESTRGDVKYREPPLLLHNNGKAVFQNMREQAGPAFNEAYSARGLAVADFDNDGDSDIIFTRLNDKPMLLRNNVGQNNHWIGFELQGTKSNRDADRAKVTVSMGSQKLIGGLREARAICHLTTSGFSWARERAGCAGQRRDSLAERKRTARLRLDQNSITTSLRMQSVLRRSHRRPMITWRCLSSNKPDALCSHRPSGWR